MGVWGDGRVAAVACSSSQGPQRRLQARQLEGLWIPSLAAWPRASPAPAYSTDALRKVVRAVALVTAAGGSKGKGGAAAGAASSVASADGGTADGGREADHEAALAGLR